MRWRAPHLISPDTVASRHPNDGWRLADPYPLTARAERGLRAVVRAMCPTELDGFEDEVADQVRRMMQYMLPHLGAGLVAAFYILEDAPRVTRRRPLSALTPDEGAEFLESLEHGPIPMASLMIFGVRALVLSAYFDRPEFHAHIGYRPTPFMNERIALRRRMVAGETPRAADHLPKEVTP